MNLLIAKALLLAQNKDQRIGHQQDWYLTLEQLDELVKSETKHNLTYENALRNCLWSLMKRYPDKYGITDYVEACTKAGILVF
jgi:hypothetical protein